MGWGFLSLPVSPCLTVNSNGIHTNTLQVCKIPRLCPQEFVLVILTHLYSLNSVFAGGPPGCTPLAIQPAGCRGESGSPSSSPPLHCQTCTESPSCYSCFHRARPFPERCSKLQRLEGFKLLSLSHTKYYTQEKNLFKFWAQVGNDIYWDCLKKEKKTTTNKTANSNMPTFVQEEWWQSPMYAHFMICCPQRSQESMWRDYANHLWMSDPAKLYICKPKQLRDCWDCYPG